MIKNARLFAVIGLLLVLTCSSTLFANDSERIKAWIQQLRRPTSNAKIQAAAKLAESGNLGELAEIATEALALCVKDPEVDVRVYGAYALGRIGADPERSIGLLAPLLSDSDEHVRYSAEWSIAEIAKVIASQPITDLTARNLLGPFVSLEEQLIRSKAQERHILAVKLGRIRLEAHAGKLTSNEAIIPPVAPQIEPPKAETNVSIAPSAVLENSMLASVSLYEANDIAGRLLLIDRMANDSLYNDDLRLAVLKHELKGTDPSVVLYAMKRWKSLGSRLIAKLCSELTDAELSTPYAENIIQSLVPDSISDWNLLSTIATTQKNPLELRVISLGTLEQSLSNQSIASPAWVVVLSDLNRLIADANETDEVRISAMRALAASRERGASSVPTLLGLISQVNLEFEMRSEIAKTLAKVAPTSSDAALGIVQCMQSMDVDSEQFLPFAESLGEFKALGIQGMDLLIKGLESNELENRLACALSLEKIGPVAVGASTALVALIADPNERVSVKNQAAKSLKAIGATEVGLLKALESQNSIVREHVLRALVQFAEHSSSIAPKCLQILSNEDETTSVRAAAASTLGCIGPQAESAVIALTNACDVSQATELRASALIALARIRNEKSREVIEANLNDSVFLVRASAAFAMHWCGSMTECVEALLDLLDESEKDELVLKAIVDLGPFATATLLEAAQDITKSTTERLCCVEALIETPPVPWTEIIKLLEDDEIGDLTASMMEAADLFESEVGAQLIEWLRSGQVNAATRNRIVKIFEANGFGAADDDAPVWAETFALNQPGLVRSATLPKKKKSAIPRRESAALAEQVAEPTMAMEAPESENPDMAEPSSEIGDGERFLPAEQRQAINSGDERKVAVFYGTNRLAIEPSAIAPSISPIHVALASIAVAAMFGCFFLFPKQSIIRYGIASLIGMGAISTIALQAMMVMSWQLEKKEPQRYTGIYSDEIQYGVCEVSIPEGHKPGELESPQLLKFEITQDPEKHIVLTNVQRMPVESFRSALKAEMDRKGKNIFVFIHGYNVSFEDAARRTAQMSFDLKFEGAPVFYSWPSQAKWYSYVMDKENIAMSTEQIRTFLMDIARTSEADTINLIAHSMGNVGLTAALSEIEMSSKPHFNQVVLAAPDIDADVFKNEIASKIVSKSHRTTLYTSKTDLALISSRYFNQRSRAGDSGPEVLVLDGIDTIDATAVDSSLLGHSYYGSNVSVLDDLSLLLRNKPIEARQYLKAIVQGKKPYWAFEPTRISKTQTTPIELSR